MNGIFYIDVAFSIENGMNARAFRDIWAQVMFLKFSKLHDPLASAISKPRVSLSYKILKIKETITVYVHSNNTNINIFCSLAPNRIRKCGNVHVQHAYFSLFLIHDVDVVVDVVDAEAHKYPV